MKKERALKMLKELRDSEELKSEGFTLTNCSFCDGKGSIVPHNKIHREVCQMCLGDKVAWVAPVAYTGIKERMRLTDEFAVSAMQALMSGGMMGKEVAKLAYEMAEHMLVRRQEDVEYWTRQSDEV